MRAGKILELLRPLVAVVDGFGTVREAHGGMGGFLGYEVHETVGRNVLDFVAPEEREEVATYFIELAGQHIQSVHRPMPFAVTLVGSDGERHAVDVIATARPSDPDIMGWVVMLIPHSLQSTATQPLNATLAGRPRSEVRRLLAEELGAENEEYSTHWFLVDVLEPTAPVVGAPSGQERFERLLTDAIAAGWGPWTMLTPDPGCDACMLSAFADVPASITAELAARGWNRLGALPVDIDGRIVGIYLEVGSGPDDEVGRLRTNVASRARRLLDVTRLILERWWEQDRLAAAATSDSLTGLANRDAFHDALATADDQIAVLYLDVDRFKEVNDTWGHHVGDRVLVEIARRVEGACRPDDVVARFGGDEFVIMLRGADDRMARQIGDRILATVAEPLGLADGPDSVSVSVGLAPCGGAGDLVEIADRAMLLAKRQGRGRIVFA